MSSQPATSSAYRAELAGRISRVLERIAGAAHRVGREPEEVTLVAVTKAFKAEVVSEAVACGLSVFGENRVQEAREKIPLLGRQGLSWHLVGHLQRNKVKYCLDLFDLIHSVDSLALAEEIDRRAEARDTVMEVLLEVNIGAEAAKHGVTPEEALSLARALGKLKRVKVKGLMTMPPWADDPEENRVHFRALRQIRDEIARVGLEGVEMKELSMGMSSDFEVAVEEGATMVRIGTAIFGSREG